MRLCDLDALKEDLKQYFSDGTLDSVSAKLAFNMILRKIDNAPTVEPEELKRVRDICEHWNDNSSSFVSACNAFEDILHIFKMGVGDIRGEGE